MTLLLAVADELGASYPENANQHQLLNVLIQFLIDTHASGKRVLLCLDEAQAMPTESLEALRLLTNLETESRKLLQVVLFGQPELDIRLDEPSIRQLKQRITFSCHLGTLNLQDTEYYLAHRLSIAGYRGARLFSRGAVRRLHRAGRGVPRLINILAHKALMTGFGEGARTITERYVKLAVLDTESTRTRYKAVRRRWLSLGALLAALAASAGALVWAQWL
jgi:MSHA biogenesis protein MshM